MDVIKSVIDKSKTRKQDAVFTNNRVLVKEGILWKRGKFTSSWKKRFFRVYTNPAHFTYVKTTSSKQDTPALDGSALEGVVKLYKGTRIVTAHATQSHSVTSYPRENALSTISTVSTLSSYDEPGPVSATSSMVSVVGAVRPGSAGSPSSVSSASPIATALSTTAATTADDGQPPPQGSDASSGSASTSSLASLSKPPPHGLSVISEAASTRTAVASSVTTMSGGTPTVTSPSGGVLYKLSLSQDVLWELACDDLLELQNWVEAFERAIASEKGDEPPEGTPVVTASGEMEQAPVWVDDSTSTVCSFCGHSFSVLTRRHHCRKCGKLVCGACTSKMVVSAISYKRVRVCRKCQPGYEAQKEAAEEKMRETEMNKMMKKRAGGGHRSAVPNKTNTYHAPRFSWDDDDEDEGLIPYGYYSRHPRRTVEPDDEKLSMYGGAGQPPSSSAAAAASTAAAAAASWSPPSLGVSLSSPALAAMRNLQQIQQQQQLLSNPPSQQQLLPIPMPLSPHQSTSQLSTSSSVSATPTSVGANSNNHLRKPSRPVPKGPIDEEEDDEDESREPRSKGSYSEDSDQGATISKKVGGSDQGSRGSPRAAKRNSGKESDSE